MNNPIDIFIAYSHHDRAVKDELRRHLRPLIHRGEARVWDGYDIEAGDAWDEVIKKELQKARIILLMVSDYSLDSDYFYGIEMTEALARHHRGEAVVVPVIVRTCTWEFTPLKALEALPEKGLPIEDWPRRNDAFLDIVRRLNSRIVQFREQPGNAIKATENQPVVTASQNTASPEALTEADHALFELTNRINTAAAYEHFLAKTRLPNGLNAAAARRRLEELAVPDFMVLIKGGDFDMGDVLNDNEDTSEKPVHRVTLSDFYMSKYAVTFDEFDTFCEATGREKPDDHKWGRGRRPVINVDWYDALEYCNWLSEQTGLTPAYRIDKKRLDPHNEHTEDTKKWTVTHMSNTNGYRLPTEAEWEYAAREGGKKVRFGDGSNEANPARINFNGKKDFKKPYSIAGIYREKTVPVDDLAANSLGLKQMIGNVWEWCWDWFDEGYYHHAPELNPSGPTAGEYRVCRGGSWYDYPENCRAGFRFGSPSVTRNSDVGFRLVRDY